MIHAVQLIRSAMFQHRRLQKTFFIVFTFLFVYVWKNEIAKPVFYKALCKVRTGETTTHGLLISNVNPDNVLVNYLADSNRGIDPLPTITLDESSIDWANNILQEYNWWDLWNDDQDCNRHQVNFLKPGTRPQPSAFVSFPGSGNTWVRSLLMAITGVFVSTFYENENVDFRPKDYYKNHSIEDDMIPSNCGCSFLQKTHDFSLDGVMGETSKENLTWALNKYQRKGILLIRNPFKAIQAYRNYQFAGMKELASSKAFEGVDWDKFVNRSVTSWETLAKVWIGGLKQGGVLYYELLRRDTKMELKRLLKMIGFKYKQDRFECVLRHTQDNPLKRKVHNKLRNPYTNSQILRIHEAIENVQLFLKERGLLPLPVELYEFFDTMKGKDDCNTF